MNSSPAAILLCAGRGTRMKDDRTHKVCYEIAGRPAILRLIDNLKQAGVSRFVVVVGSKADKVMDCLDGVEGVVYAYQKTQNGTGNAAYIGLKALRSTGYTGNAFVCMGDKIIDPLVFKWLIEEFGPGDSAVFAVTPKDRNPSGGRVLMKNGKVCGIIEQMDSYLRHISTLLPLDESELENAVGSFGLSEKKSAKLLESAKKLTSVIPTELCGHKFSPKDIESGKYVNSATYLVDVDTALSALSNLSSNNAQGELYMTDAINDLSANGGTKIVPVTEPHMLLTYSTMEELIKLEKYFASHVSRRIPKASELLDRIRRRDSGMEAKFVEIYGNDSRLLAERRESYILLLERFLERFGDREILIARAPGRLNVMGRHIEHRGGSINVLTISREMLVAVSPTEDDVVTISNVKDGFEDYSFSILDHIKKYDTENWLEFIESASITSVVEQHKGDWINYVKAAILRLQLGDRKKALCGMNMMFLGNIPMAAGLSSSSSIVVSTMEAAVALNGIELDRSEFIRLCGEGEWFVGSRGGAGDHAAMKCGSAGSITHLYFNPFSVGESVPFPEDYRLIVANSFVEAKKSAGAKDIFNSKIAGYEFGLMLLKKNFPQYAEKMKVLKDVNPKTLSVPPSRIYEMLITLPERMTAEEVRQALPEESDRIERIFKTHTPPEFYDIRSVVLYGIAECERSEFCIRCLKSGDISRLGELMNTSHNGDRVASGDKKYDYSANELYLYRLINDLKSEHPAKVSNAQIHNQPGGYACSTADIDGLVDSVLAQKGVLGAQLSGAGLGGCIMILVKREDADSVIDFINKTYYKPRGFRNGAEIFSVIAGSGVVD